jgi:hypothetical protein
MTDSKPSQKNRRLALRRLPKGKVKVICYKGSFDLGANLALAVINVSETGIRLVIASALAEGQEVLVHLEGQGHMRPIKNHGTVVWCIPSNDGNFVVGIHFHKSLRYKDFTHLT